jgi:hypothetical protein
MHPETQATLTPGTRTSTACYGGGKLKGNSPLGSRGLIHAVLLPSTRRVQGSGWGSCSGLCHAGEGVGDTPTIRNGFVQLNHLSFLLLSTHLLIHLIESYRPCAGPALSAPQTPRISAQHPPKLGREIISVSGEFRESQQRFAAGFEGRLPEY